MVGTTDTPVENPEIEPRALDEEIKVSMFMEQIKKWPHWKEFMLGLAAVILWLSGIYAVYFSAPSRFPVGVIVKIRKGTTIAQVANGLYQHDLIRSPLLFKVLARVTDDGKVIAGDYKFAGRENVIDIAIRLTRGLFGIETSKVMIEEGHDTAAVARLLDKSLPAGNEKILPQCKTRGLTAGSQ